MDLKLEVICIDPKFSRLPEDELIVCYPAVKPLHEPVATSGENPKSCCCFYFQETTITEIKQKIMKIPDANGLVIDGFPRDVGQALSFEDQVSLPLRAKSSQIITRNSSA